MAEATGEVLIITGMSGAGRTTVGNALEDLDWYVVDNLPPQMLRPLLDLSGRLGDQLPRVAAVVDVRGRDMFSELPSATKALRELNNVKTIFLDSSDEVLVRRFEAVRRPHPLQSDGTLLDGIQRERQILAPVRESADVIIDTSAFNVHQLSLYVTDLLRDEDRARHHLTLVSFGFKYGLPPDADLVADMRFLPNPYWERTLRDLTGEDQRVSDYVLEQEGAGEFLDSYERIIRIVTDGYQREHKSHSTVAIGCTGGKHRSVAMSLALAERVSQLPGVAVRVRHRDLGRE